MPDAAVGLILRSLLCMLVLIAGYEMAFRALRSSYMPRADSVPILNAMTAQNYLYERGDSPVVIVGSSLSGRLQADLLDAHTYNLAFGGLSALDGLELVNHASTQPQLLLIESNVLFRPARKSFLDRLLSPPMVWLRKPMWVMRDVARPLTVALSYAQSLARRLMPASSAAAAVATPMPAVAGPPAAVVASVPAAGSLFDRMLDLQRVAYAREISADERTIMLDSLSRNLQVLKTRGVHVLFFEMPTHPDLCELPRQEGLRENLRAAFPDVPYVRLGECQGIQSTDGVHLTLDEARQVAVLINRLVERQLREFLAQPQAAQSAARFTQYECQERSFCTS